KIPKDFGNAFVEMTFHTAQDAEYAEVRREIAENGNGEVIDIEATVQSNEQEFDSEPPSEPKQPDTEPADQPEQHEHDHVDESEGQEQLDFDSKQSAPGF